jgi:hypothetical protein
MPADDFHEDALSSPLETSALDLKLESYRLRLLATVQDWHLLAGGTPQTWTEQVREVERLFAPLGNGVEPSQWREYSKLCSDGSPVEWCERLSEEDTHHGPAYTIDPAPYTKDEELKLPLCRQTMEMLLAQEGLDISLPGDLIRILNGEFMDQPIPAEANKGVASLWMGVEHRPDRPKRLIKLYFNLNWRHMPEPWEQLSFALTRLGCPPDSLTEWMIRPLGMQGYPKMLAIALSADARNAAKLYYRMHQMDKNRLFQIIEGAAWSRKPFENYLKHVLKSGEFWSDGNTGIGLGLRGEAGLTSLSLFHYAAPYFQNDTDLRHRILSTASEFSWKTEGFRLSSRLLEAPDEQHHRLRNLLGFSVHANGRTGLRIYSRTGYLAGLV